MFVMYLDPERVEQKHRNVYDGTYHMFEINLGQKRERLKRFHRYRQCHIYWAGDKTTTAHNETALRTCALHTWVSK